MSFNPINFASIEQRSINLFDANNLQSKTINPSGWTLDASATDKCSQLIPVAAGAIYCYKSKSSNFTGLNNWYAVFYNNAGTIIDHVEWANQGRCLYHDGAYVSSSTYEYTSHIFKVPVGATKVVMLVSYNNQLDMTNAKLELGTIPTDYSKFREPYISLDPVFNSPWYGKKAVFFGDSQSQDVEFTSLLQKKLGIWYNLQENYAGIGYTPTAVAGSIVTGLSSGVGGHGATHSMYYRASDVYRYSPDIIFFWGGTNDATTPGVELGLLPDVAYTGAVVAEPSDVPTYVSSYKGALKKLLSNSPLATVIGITIMQYGEARTGGTVERKLMIAKYTEECCKEYGVKCVNLYTSSGISYENRTSFLRDDLHLNHDFTTGSLRVSNTILSIL